MAIFIKHPGNDNCPSSQNRSCTGLFSTDPEERKRRQIIRERHNKINRVMNRIWERRKTLRNNIRKKNEEARQQKIKTARDTLRLAHPQFKIAELQMGLAESIQLTANEEIVLYMYVYQQLSSDIVGEMLGVARQRIYQIHKGLLRKLNRPTIKHKIKHIEYLCILRQIEQAAKNPIYNDACYTHISKPSRIKKSPRVNFWNKDNVIKIKLLLRENLSAAEIGRRLGITKNAVIGKINRLKRKT